MQHWCQPFGPCVQTDINATGLVVKGPRVSICPRAPSRSVTLLISMLLLNYALYWFNNNIVTLETLRAVQKKVRIPGWTTI